MKIQWIAAALLSSALVVGCGDRKSENEQNQEQKEGTSVAIAPDAGDQANLQPPAAVAPAPSPNRDASAVRRDTPGSSGSRTSAARTSPAPATREPAPPSGERFEPAAPRASVAPAPRESVRTYTI